MADEEQKIIFSKNLNKYLSLSNKAQKEVADAIDVSPQTFNTWCQGIALPRMGKVQRLADYFGIGKTDLIDEKPPDPLTPRDERDIEKILDQTREQLLSQEGLMFDGQPVRKPSNLFCQPCRSAWSWQRKRTRKNTLQRSIKRAD